MKILDRYILTTYLKTFFSVFIILILIFILQTVWLYIKELAGKDLDPIVIVKFLAYFMPKLIPLVLPLTILLSSIMVFGTFAENYEFAAMKSTGISLQRAMSGLSVFIVLLGIITFFFANNVIPWAELKSYNLRRNIAKLKPAMLLVEGQFNDVASYNIKFAKKSGDNDRFLEDVTIHIKGSDGRTNAKTIKAKTGELYSEKDSNVLQLILFDGNYYEDLLPKDRESKLKKPFAKGTFKKDFINIDLSQLNNIDYDDESYTDRHNMLNIVDLNKALDSLIQNRKKINKGIAKNLHQRSKVSKFTKNIESNTVNDSLYSISLLDFFDTKNSYRLIDQSLKATVSSSQVINQKISSFKGAKVNFNKHIISFHDKFALGFACIILFFVGAPLGALIRKGGIGLPMVIAILLFLTYHFIGIFAINSAKNGGFNPVLASWFSTLVMLPLGIYLTKRATEDKGLFEVGNIIEPLKKVFNIKAKNSVDYKFLSTYKNEKLLDTISDYKTLGHDEGIRFEAITLLKQKGLRNNTLRESGVIIDKKFDTSEKIIKDYREHSKFTITLYSIGVVLLVLFFVFKNNKLPSVASASIQLSLASFFLFVIYYIKSILNLFSFYKHINKNEKHPNLAFLIIGLPLYIFVYPFFNIKIKEDLKQNCLDSLK